MGNYMKNVIYTTLRITAKLILKKQDVWVQVGFIGSGWGSVTGHCGHGMKLQFL